MPLNSLDDDLLSRIYLEKTRDDLIEINVTNGLTCNLQDLGDNNTYYWKIAIDREKMDATVESEIYRFTVEMDFEFIHKLEMHFNTASIDIRRGDSAAVNLTIRNIGNVKEDVLLEALGELKGLVS